jgi:hypothetical protein
MNPHPLLLLLLSQVPDYVLSWLQRVSGKIDG